MNDAQKLLVEDGEDATTLYLYGVIGNDWSAESTEQNTDTNFLRKFKAAEKRGKEIHIRINSPGGNPFHADAMMTAISSSKADVHIWVDGTAASCAADLCFSVPTEKLHIAKNGKLMIHPTSTYTFGNANDHAAAVNKLRTFDDTAIAMMATNAKMTEADIRKRFYADGQDHWLTAKECLELGFVCCIEDYNAENTLTNAEKMTHEDLLKSYSPSKKETKSWIQHLFKREAAATATIADIPNPTLNIFESPVIIPEMTPTPEEIRKAAIDNMTYAELEAILVAKKAATPASQLDLDALRKEIVAKDAKIDTLMANVEKLMKTTSGGMPPLTPDGGADGANDPAATKLTKDQQAHEDFNNEMLKAHIAGIDAY
jgi:ATP-dependent protease ClpP protease subunit